MAALCCESSRVASPTPKGLRDTKRDLESRLPAFPVSVVMPSAFHRFGDRKVRSIKCYGKSLRTQPPVLAVAQHQAAVSTSLQEVEFFWKGNASDVLLTGSFLNWETKVALKKIGEGLFSAKQKLKPGSYSYKYIVDGEWKHDDNMPTISDGAGGLNNTLTVQASIEPKSEPPTTPEVPAASSVPKPAPTPVPAAPAAETKPVAEAKPATEAKPAAKAAGKKAAGKKAAAKPIGEAMNEDVIPQLSVELGKEDISELDLVFEDNQLRGSFLKNGVRYQFCAYFPDGNLDGARGFSLTSRGNPFSTVEPFLIDERKVTPELLVFWVKKRLFAQKLLSLN